jgi:signal peptidase I
LSAIRRIIFGSDPRRTAVRVGVLAVISFVTFRWVLMPIRAEGVSMLPTYQSGTLHFVNRLAYSSSSPPARGDIVAIRLGGEHVLYVKRVIALPGERVRMTAGEIFINGVSLAEPYVRTRQARDLPEVLLARDEYFVIGDNRSQSDFGRVEASRIAGKVVF